jgi:hypothetical protein
MKAVWMVILKFVTLGDNFMIKVTLTVSPQALSGQKLKRKYNKSERRRKYHGYNLEWKSYEAEENPQSEKKERGVKTIFKTGVTNQSQLST